MARNRRPELPREARMELQTVDSAFAKGAKAVLASVSAGKQAVVYCESCESSSPLHKICEVNYS